MKLSSAINRINKQVVIPSFINDDTVPATTLSDTPIPDRHVVIPPFVSGVNIAVSSSSTPPTIFRVRFNLPVEVTAGKAVMILSYAATRKNPRVPKSKQNRREIRIKRIMFTWYGTNT